MRHYLKLALWAVVAVFLVCVFFAETHEGGSYSACDTAQDPAECYDPQDDPGAIWP